MKHVALVAPSYKVSETDITLGKAFLEDAGFQVSVSITRGDQDFFCTHPQDAVRFKDLQHALEDPSVDVIWALRGGYGLTRLVPPLLSLKKPEKEKLFVGFSDGSILHMFLNQMWGWSSLHAPVIAQFFQNLVSPKSCEETVQMVKEGLGTWTPHSLDPLNASAKALSSLEGEVVGGNLCLITCGLGTPLHLDPTGKNLFLEEIDERGYRIDRMLMQLQQARVLDAPKAVIFGDFVGGEEQTGQSFVDPVIERFAGASDIPMFRIKDRGHGKQNLPLPFNFPLTFSVKKS